MLINRQLLVLSSQLGHLLQQRKARVTTAESCTGGAIAAAITAVSGSSEWFDGGFVTYSNQFKQQWLGVPEAIISVHGVVSEPVVSAMLAGACLAANADFGISVSGIAGPAGGSETKPVGTVCVAWGAPKNQEIRTFHFDGERDSIREASVDAALQGLISYLKITV